MISRKSKKKKNYFKTLRFFTAESLEKSVYEFFKISQQVHVGLWIYIERGIMYYRDLNDINGYFMKLIFFKPMRSLFKVFLWTFLSRSGYESLYKGRRDVLIKSGTKKKTNDDMETFRGEEKRKLIVLFSVGIKSMKGVLTNIVSKCFQWYFL